MKDAQGQFDPPSEEDQKKMQEQALAFSKCMRDHGIDMPDPTFSADGGGLSVSIGGPPDSDPTNDGPLIDFNSKEFQDASEACGGPGGGGFAVATNRPPDEAALVDRGRGCHRCSRGRRDDDDTPTHDGCRWIRPTHRCHGRRPKVTRTDLVEEEKLRGALGYGDSKVIGTDGSGIITELPDVGTVLKQGDSAVAGRRSRRPCAVLRRPTDVATLCALVSTTVPMSPSSSKT